ncbi:hypothetical protein [Pontixanthobacter sp.]|uniref:hypothetical protein n=1 Tax=Pontixanthobacter sp. TaxID=2792078 RepID=UPI003C7AB40E
MIRAALQLVVLVALAACADSASVPPLCSFDESGKMVMQSGNTEAACVEPAPVPKGAVQETTGRITILEAPLHEPFSSLTGDGSSSAPVNPDRPVPEALPAELSYYIRSFPRAEEPAGDVLDLGSEHTIILRDGCFYLDREGTDNPLVQFPFGTRIGVDAGGYLAFNTGSPMAVRVGLPAQTGWFTEPYDPPEDVAALCGADKMVAVTTVSSPYAYPERFNPSLRRYGKRSGATPAQIVAPANQCAIRQARREADRRIRDGALNPIDCTEFWGF